MLLEESVLECIGDCDGNREVLIDELVSAVELAVEKGPAESCAAVDANRDDTVAVNELIAAVGNALDGCP
jgi:hypothetical protein